MDTLTHCSRFVFGYFQLFLILSSFQLNYALIRNDLTVDFSYEFNSLEGWADASADQSQIDVKIESGELRGTILGSHPVLDSPLMNMNVDPFHYITLRLRYMGTQGVRGKISFRTGAYQQDEPTGLNYMPWSARQTPSVLSDSGSISDHPASNLFDDNNHSYWESISVTGAFIIFDFGDYRTVNEMRILPSYSNKGPRRCLLQVSQTTGVGPFETTAAFTLKNSSSGLDSSMQSVTGLSTTRSRYWRLLVLDNYGGSSVAIHSLHFLGSDSTIISVPIDINPNGSFQVYSLPLYPHFSGNLLRIRLSFEHNLSAAAPSAEYIAIDYIRLLRAPDIHRVTGCLDQYFNDVNMRFPYYDVTSKIQVINNHLSIYSFTKNSMSLPYASTYDCPLEGHISITIDGYNFGETSLVYVGATLCEVTDRLVSPIDGRRETIVCRLPSGESGLKTVRVENGMHRALFAEASYLKYRVSPATPQPPVLTNIGSTRVDLSWLVPGDIFAKMTVTGYIVRWRAITSSANTSVQSIVVSNITQTSVRALSPNTSYAFSIACLSEGFHTTSLSTDLYGRREIIASTYSRGNFSADVNATTLQFDFDFPLFNVNLTLNHSSTSANSNGPTGNYGGEGHYGLHLIGSAHLQNCNASSSCCDGFNPNIGISSCISDGISVCSVSILGRDNGDTVNGDNRRKIPSNYISNTTAAIYRMHTSSDFLSTKASAIPSRPCGASIRLTSSAARQSGSFWYSRKQNVAEGFDVYFSFEISNPSEICQRMSDVYTFCRSRGADGFAFVIHNSDSFALGKSGSGLGYEEMPNGIAIEFDTFYNYDRLDHYENHISVITRGWRYNLTSNHSYALGTTSRIPDLTRDRHKVRIRYDPNINLEDAFHVSFQTTEQGTWFLENADYTRGGQGDWGAGVGMMYVYVDDLEYPVISMYMSLSDTVHLDDGRAFVGFTAATGDNMWQTHDILDWQFRSLHIDKAYTRPTIVNGEGSFDCVDEQVCVHARDVEHFIRQAATDHA